MWRDFILNWQNFFQGLHFIFYFIYVNVFPQTALVFYHIAHFPYFNVWLSLMCWIEQCFFFVLLFGRGVTHISNSFEMEIRSLNCGILVSQILSRSKIDQQNIARNYSHFMQVIRFFSLIKVCRHCTQSNIKLCWKPDTFRSMHTLIYSGKCERCLLEFSLIKCLSSPILFLSLLRCSCLLI